MDISMFPQDQQDLMIKRSKLSALCSSILPTFEEEHKKTCPLDGDHDKCVVPQEVLQEFMMLNKECQKITDLIIEMQRPDLENNTNWSEKVKEVKSAYSDMMDKYDASE